MYNGVQLGSWFDGPLVSLSLPIYESTQPSTSHQIVRPHNDSSGIFANPMFFNFSFVAHVSSIFKSTQRTYHQKVKPPLIPQVSLLRGPLFEICFFSFNMGIAQVALDSPLLCQRAPWSTVFRPNLRYKSSTLILIRS